MTERTVAPRGPAAAEPVVHVRPATDLDLDGLLASMAALFAEDAGPRDPAADPTWFREHGRAALAAGLDDPARLLLVADCAGKVLGHLTAMLRAPEPLLPVRTVTLASLYVRPAMRGAGTGSRLLAGCLDWSRAHGAFRTEVSAYASNAAALRFYHRHGFTDHEVTLTAPGGWVPGTGAR
ncbi:MULTISPECIES: GNAT family N-acetyltransferase [Streptomyces]|uniref:GNAT family N-acetyltransferase n=1 Tax=Streptomyces TaxID=1883 RepID=UPI00143ACCF9|nr:MULTISPECIES: GNAT family N-acetyltransferase [unclassified Streptomyces]MDT0423360.1 GNAT family N-acetyltransferase [Streptomyces sp. DSM 41859]NJA54997.1 GNAT family N-acetyltransferase [Streptomyces sp. NEAU-H3]